MRPRVSVRIAQEPGLGVMRCVDAEQSPGHRVGVSFRAELPERHGLADKAGDRPDEFPQRVYQEVVHRPRHVVELGCRADERAATGQPAAARPTEKPAEKAVEPRQPRRFLERGPDDRPLGQSARRAEELELQRPQRPEMRVEPTFGQSGVFGELAERNAAETPDADELEALTLTTVRVLSYTGTATIFFGLLLVPRTRGYDSLLGGEWGGIVVSCIVIAVALLGLGDSALRPALRRLKETRDVRPARRLALTGFALSLLAVGLMTRALYAPT